MSLREVSDDFGKVSGKNKPKHPAPSPLWGLGYQVLFGASGCFHVEHFV